VCENAAFKKINLQELRHSIEMADAQNSIIILNIEPFPTHSSLSLSLSLPLPSQWKTKRINEIARVLRQIERLLFF
jgi:hypothetical protein